MAKVTPFHELQFLMFQKASAHLPPESRARVAKALQIVGRRRLARAAAAAAVAQADKPPKP